MNAREDSYSFTERQYGLFTACIDSWRTTTFWTLMYMQSFLFDAKNTDNIGRELDTQPAQYELIFRHYYGEGFASIGRLSVEASPKYFKPFLTALKAGRGTEASEMKRRWLLEVESAAEKFARINPFWSAAVFKTMLTHYITLLCTSAENDVLGKYQEIGDTYLVLDRLAGELGEYMAVGIIRQFNIA